MFFLFPVSHERQEARRWPLVTLLIIFACVVISGAVQLVSGTAERSAMEAASEVLGYHKAHPELEVRCGLQADDAEPAVPSFDLAPNTQGKVRSLAPARGDGADAVSDQLPVHDDGDQGELDRLCQLYRDASAHVPRDVYGDVPARGGLLTLFTHPFLHAGWLHLLANMWFLWLCGANLEDRWGRALFPVFYLLSGAAGALLHRALTPQAWVPLIGASGAIAGAMGAFLVTLGATHIRFAYVVWITLKPKWGTFQARAYVMLPLWLASELLWGLVTPTDGTAHWAHVGGFAFGAAVAFGLKWSGLDARLDAHHEAKITTSQDPALLAAMELTDAGRADQALSALTALVHARPHDIDVWLETLRAATVARNIPRQGEAYLRLIDLYLGSDAAPTAADLVRELAQQRLLARVPRAELLRIGEGLARKEEADAALLCLAQAHEPGLVDAPSVRAAVLHATLLVRRNRVLEAQRLLAAARGSPFVTPELLQRIDAQLQVVSLAP